MNFTVRFKRTGCKEIEPLEASIVSRGILGSIPVKFVAMEANDGKFVDGMIFKMDSSKLITYSH